MWSFMLRGVVKFRQAQLVRFVLGAWPVLACRTHAGVSAVP